MVNVTREVRLTPSAQELCPGDALGGVGEARTLRMEIGRFYELRVTAPVVARSGNNPTTGDWRLPADGSRRFVADASDLNVSALGTADALVFLFAEAL
jgi:hypothetical protein